MSDGSTITIPGGDEIGNGAPLVFLPMTRDENPFRLDRENTQEYQSRTPFCVPDFARDGATIVMANAGKTASDLVIIDYRLILCSLESHGPQDGFPALIHAGEVAPDPTDLYATADFVAPAESKPVRLSWPSVNWAANLYLRVRVSTLWTAPRNVELWDPVHDPRVTEAYLNLN